MNCRKCGSILRRNARFCHKCGCAQIPSDVERDRKPQVGRMAKNPDDYSDRDVVSFLYDIEEKRERIRRYKNESVEEILKSEGIERPEELKKMKVSLKNIRKYIPSKMEKFSWVKFTFFAVLTKNNPDKAESLSKNVRGSISRFVFLLLGIYLLSLHITIAGLVCLAIAALFEVWNFTAWRAGRKGINERNSIVDEYYKIYPQAVAEYEETVATRANEIEVELKELSRCVSESASIENMLSARLGAKYRNLDDLKMLNTIFEDTRANTIPEAVNCLLEDKRAEEESQMAEELARRIGQSPQNFNAKMKRGTISETELIQIADELGIAYEQSFTLPNGEKIEIKNGGNSVNL